MKAIIIYAYTSCRDHIDLANGPATEWHTKSLTTHDALLAEELVLLEARFKEAWAQNGETDPVAFFRLAVGYTKAGIVIHDSTSEDILATISGIDLAHAFRKAFSDIIIPC